MSQGVRSVVPYLRKIPQEVLRQKLAAVQQARSRFFFRSRLTDPPNAVNTMTAGICARHKCGPHAVWLTCIILAVQHLRQLCSPVNDMKDMQIGVPAVQAPHDLQ